LSKLNNFGVVKCVSFVKEKSFSLNTRELGILEENIILEELDKCVLLCANCHAEEHCSYDIFERYYSDAENK